MKLPKIPIDYSKAGTGEAPFDYKKEQIFHFKCFKPQIGRFIDGVLYFGAHAASEYGIVVMPTHYTPMPELYEVDGEA